MFWSNAVPFLHAHRTLGRVWHSTETGDSVPKRASGRVFMGKPLSLTAADSHRLGAYRADPAGKPKGGVVVIQEIFGVNHHIRAVCDRVAEAGYVAVAPALFDRTMRDFQSGYSPEEIARARKFVEAPDWDAML